MNKFKGRIAWIFDDHFDVDLIIGVRNIMEKDINKLVDACMKDFDLSFTQLVRQGDFLVAGRNFGYGHPHPQAMRVIRHLGIRAIVAKSFARVFFKNEIASGMALLPCPNIPDNLKRWGEVQADLNKWHIKFSSLGNIAPLANIPQVEVEIIKSGGVVPYLKKQESH